MLWLLFLNSVFLEILVINHLLTASAVDLQLERHKVPASQPPLSHVIHFVIGPRPSISA